MIRHQHGILAPVPLVGRFLVFGLAPGADARTVLDRLRNHRPHEGDVVGLGAPLVGQPGERIGLRPFPALVGPGCAVPSTQGALYASFAGTDSGELLQRARALTSAFGGTVVLDEDVLAYKYGEGRDLSGYEDGTENPKGDAAEATALVSGGAEGIDGSSFVAVQRWVHDLARFDEMTATERDQVIGRRRDTNEEIDDAPAFAHVKRTAQESFDPPAFMLRRSMPWGNLDEHGLYFVAYGASLDSFERSMRRMLGQGDGIVDGLFRFSRAVSGGYYWCPPMDRGALDLRALDR